MGTDNNPSLKGVRILITGGAGMIGSTIAMLAAQRGALVTILDAMLPLYGGNQFNLHNIGHKITFVEGDIRQRECVESLVEDKDIVFNLAAQVSYVDSNLDPYLDLDINCRGILNVLEACRTHAPKARVLFSSSRFVYGRVEYNPVDEAHPFNCLSIYGIHKLAGEKYHRFFYDDYHLNTTMLRIANPYGPRQQMKHGKYGIVNWFIRQALDGKPLTVFGDGSQKRDYVYVDDLAEAFLAVALSPNTAGEVYNVGSGYGASFRSMVDAIAHLIPGTVVHQVEWPKDRYFVETGDYISDIRKLQTATGWNPETSLEAGIASTIDYYRLNREKYW